MSEEQPQPAAPERAAMTVKARGYPRPGPAGVSALLITAMAAGVTGLLIAAVSTFPDFLDGTKVQFRTTASPALTSQMIVVIASSLRRDAAEDASLMPRLAAARSRGSWGIAQTSPIPLSSSAVWALTVGHPFSPLDLYRDFYSFRAPATSIVHQAVSAGLRVCLVGPRHLTSPFVGEAQVVVEVPISSFRDFTTDDETIFQHAVALTRSRSCTLLVLHFEGPDAAGHIYGGMSPPYREVVRQVDRLLGGLDDLDDGATTFLVVSDHGIDDVGDHSTAAEPMVRDAPFVLWGSGVTPGVSVSIRQVDLALLIAALLGFPSPPDAVGTVPLALLRGPPSSQAQILAQAVEQKARYLEAYASQYHRRLSRAAGGWAPVQTLDSSVEDTEAERRALAQLETMAVIYRDDLHNRAWQRLALGASVGMGLLVLLGILLGATATLGGGATPVAGPGARWRAAAASGLVGLMGLLPLTLPEPGTSWGTLVLLTPLPLGLAALGLSDIRLLTHSPVWSGAIIAWGVAAGLPVWLPQLPMAFDLPPFRPAFLVRYPLWLGVFSLVVAGGGALLALAFRSGDIRWVRAAVPLLAFTFTLLSGSFHDLVHWVLVVAVAAGLSLSVIRRHAAGAPSAAAVGLLAVLTVRRMRGLALTGGLGEWWVPWLCVAAASVLLLGWIHRLWKGAPPPGRRGMAVADIALPGFLLLLLGLAGTIRWLDLQTVSRWMHPAILGVIALVCMLTRNVRVRLPIAMGGLLALSYLLFDPYGFLALTIVLAVIWKLWQPCVRFGGTWGPVAAGLVYFFAVWLLFFGTGNEFDLTAIHSLRTGLLGWDIGGPAGFSVGWTASLIALKFSLLHLLPLLALAAAVSLQTSEFRWPAFLSTGTTLSFALFVAAFVRLHTIGYGGVGAILLTGISCILFLPAFSLRPFTSRVGGEDEGPEWQLLAPLQRRWGPTPR